MYDGAFTSHERTFLCINILQEMRRRKKKVNRRASEGSKWKGISFRRIPCILGAINLFESKKGKNALSLPTPLLKLSNGAINLTFLWGKMIWKQEEGLEILRRWGWIFIMIKFYVCDEHELVCVLILLLLTFLYFTHIQH